MKKYQPVIGLEIHVELKTKSKMFCQCDADYFGKTPNSQVCPVCLGLPGALPVPNRQAIDWTILIGKALNCQINNPSKFDRKHYFYPDLPKGYQISQYDLPFCQNGYLEIYPSDLKENRDYQKLIKKFRIRRVHLEEDTGKLIHQKEDTLIDFNRAGVPLVEIVTEPDFDNSDEVKRFLEELHVLIRYLKVSDCDMEKGTMRLEPNISILTQKSNPRTQNLNHTSQNSNPISQNSPSDSEGKTQNRLPPYKVEIKNINSFRFVKQAIDYEIERQIALLEKGITPKQETRGFDNKKGVTYSQRLKEEAHDYRYFPEPDIPPIILTKEEIEAIKLPSLPFDEIKRLISEYQVRYEDAFVLSRHQKQILLFTRLIKKLKTVLKEKKVVVDNLNQKVLNLIVNKKVSFTTDEEFINKALTILLPQKTDETLLMKAVTKVIKENAKAVNDYKSGKKNALMFLVGQVMKEVKGKASAKEIIDRLIKLIS